MRDLGWIGSTRRASARAWLFAVTLALAGLFVSARAEAQTVTIDTGNIMGGDMSSTRASMYQFYISYQDCIAGTSLDPSDPGWFIELPVTVASSATGTLELWAAETDDCSLDTSRVAGTGECKQLPLVSTVADTYTITAQQIVSVLGIGADCVDNSGSSSVRTVTLYFLLAGSTETTAGTIDPTNIASYPVSVELTGPLAPTGLSLGVGDGLLILNLQTNMDANTQGYYIFCNPNPNPQSGVDAGTCVDAGTTTSSSSSGAGGADAGTTSSSSSSSSSGGGAGGTSGVGGAFVIDAGPGPTDCSASTTLPCLDPAHPTINSPYLCSGQIPASATAPVIPNLTNGTAYVISIAGYDNVNNIGPLATLQCGTPLPTETFFNQYCADGGSGCGGCGSCAVGADTDIGWAGLATVALAAAGLGARRERRHHARLRRRARSGAETE